MIPKLTPTPGTHQSEPAPTSSTTTKSKSLNPVAKPFIPNALDQLYTKHAAALNRQRAIKIQMDTFQDMSMTAEESGYDHERLGEMSRDLAFRFMDAVDDTAGLEREIEGLFGREALIGRNTHLNDEK